MKKLMIIALLALVLLTIVPSLAYTTLYSVDLSDRTTTTPQFIYWTTTPGDEGFVLAVRDIVYFTNVTHIEYQTIGNWPNNLTASYETRIKSGSTLLGNATWSVNWQSAYNYSAHGTITIDIHDFNRQGLTGDQNIRFVDVPRPTTYVWLHSQGTDWVTSGFNSLYAVTPYQASGYKYNGTYLIQGGSPSPTPPTVDFTASNTTGQPGLISQFIGITDAPSTGRTLLWSTSGPALVSINDTTALNPVMNFPSVGAYTINFTVTNSTGWAHIEKTNYITVTAANSSVVRTYFRTKDPAGNFLMGTDIQIRDVQNNFWSNFTNTQDGTGYIDSYNDHTLNAYSQLTGYQSVSRLGLAPLGIYSGVYDLTMYPNNMLADPGPGNVNLIFYVSDKNTKQPLSATVSITTPSGSTTGQATGDGGSTVFVAPNVSIITYKVTASGYNSVAGSITTTTFGPDTQRVELTKMVVTPTISTVPTDPATGLTLAPGQTPYATIDPRTPQQKDEDMMTQVRNAAPNLIGLFILCTIIFLLKGIGK